MEYFYDDIEEKSSIEIEYNDFVTFLVNVQDFDHTFCQSCGAEIEDDGYNNYCQTCEEE